MKHLICKIERFEIVGNFHVKLVFDDQTEKVVDLQPLLWGKLFEPLQDPLFFNKAQLDLEVKTLVWPNGADFDPATLYELPSVSINVVNELPRRFNCGAKDK